MCKDLREYKLCTCSSKIDKTKPYWVLSKRIPVLITLDIVGTLITPDEQFLLTEDRLLFDLNSKNIFDFDYQPLENDILIVFDGVFTYEFIYKKNELYYKWEAHKYFYPNFDTFQKKEGYIDGDLPDVFDPETLKKL